LECPERHCIINIIIVILVVIIIIMLAAKKTAQETFFRSILSKEGKCWPEFYKYVKTYCFLNQNIHSRAKIQPF
jgi:Ni,Fe-hydrogenase I cytochrome b subunit